MFRVRRYALRALFVLFFIVWLAMAAILLPWIWPFYGRFDVADNGWTDFAQTIEHSRDVSDGYSHAYDRLCHALQARVSRNAFVQTRGNVIFSFLPYETWQGFGERYVGKKSAKLLVTVYSQGHRLRLVMDFERERGRWRLCAANSDAPT